MPSTCFSTESAIAEKKHAASLKSTASRSKIPAQFDNLKKQGIAMKIKRVVPIVPVLAGLLLLVGLTLSQEPTTRRQISAVRAAAELPWTSAADGNAYASIDGKRMKRHVEELVAISRKSRDAGDLFWGRIAGMPSGHEAEEWLAAKFKQAGLDVRRDPLQLRPLAFPKSWQATVSGSGKTLALKSASPIIAFANYMPSAEGNLNVDSVWVGLGMESDFLGKNVRGKAVFIYSVPTPSSLIQSASWMGAVGRAQDNGAAAVFVIVAIPGNMSFVSHLQGLSDAKVPIFTLGLDDGEAVEAINAKSGGSGWKTQLRWNVETLTGLKGSNVVGILPGVTDESIVMVSHLDGFFDGANDNAAGVASMLGVAEFFAARPQQQRRRTMYFVGIADHHTGDEGGRNVHDTWQNTFAKTAVVVNAEHVALAEPVWDRRWGSNDRPSLIKTNTLGPSWWGVNGSDRLADIVRDGFAVFGVPTQIEPGGSPGELRAVQWDAPSFYLHNKGVYYHSSADTPEVVPAEGLRTATQAFAKIFDDVNKLDLKDLRASGSR